MLHRFHDDTPFNAEAVKFNLDRILDPATKSLHRSAVAGIRNIEVIDSHTIRVTLAGPDAAFLAALSASQVIAGDDYVMNLSSPTGALEDEATVIVTFDVGAKPTAPT